MAVRHSTPVTRGRCTITSAGRGLGLPPRRAPLGCAAVRRHGRGTGAALLGEPGFVSAPFRSPRRCRGGGHGGGGFRSSPRLRPMRGGALLRAIAAGAEADEAVAASEAIQAAAAAEKRSRPSSPPGSSRRRPLTKRSTALAAAGLVVAGADEATRRAISPKTPPPSPPPTRWRRRRPRRPTPGSRQLDHTVAEAQVLRYLPKPVPFSLITRQAGDLSRSAAKDHAERLARSLAFTAGTRRSAGPAPSA